MADRITQPQHSIEIDEQWLQEWIAFGFREMRRYLTLQAAFAAYCERRDQGAQHDTTPR